MAGSLDLVTVTNRRNQWVETTKNLQQKAQELSRELAQVQDQLAQLTGAIQACDILLNDVQVASPDSSTTTLTE